MVIIIKEQIYNISHILSFKYFLLTNYGKYISVIVNTKGNHSDCYPNDIIFNDFNCLISQNKIDYLYGKSCETILSALEIIRKQENLEQEFLKLVPSNKIEEFCKLEVDKKELKQQKKNFIESLKQYNKEKDEFETIKKSGDDNKKEQNEILKTKEKLRLTAEKIYLERIKIARQMKFIEDFSLKNFVSTSLTEQR